MDSSKRRASRKAAVSDVAGNLRASAVRVVVLNPVLASASAVRVADPDRGLASAVRVVVLNPVRASAVRVADPDRGLVEEN